MHIRDQTLKKRNREITNFVSTISSYKWSKQSPSKTCLVISVIVHFLALLVFDFPNTFLGGNSSQTPFFIFLIMLDMRTMT